MSNYVSDSAIMAWVSQVQEQQYGQLQAAMDFETTRGEMLQDLAAIKSGLRQSAKDTTDIDKLNEQVQAFLEKYGEVEDFADIADVVRQFAPGVSDKAAQNAALPEALNQHAMNPVDAQGDPTPEPTTAEPFGKEGVADWNKALDELGDTSNHNEQLGMIRINEIKSTIDHGAEVASQLIKSSNDTSAFAINNIV